MKAIILLLSGLAAGIVCFLLYWLFYGYLLVDFMNINSGTAVWVYKDNMFFWPIILGNLLTGWLLAYVFTVIGNIKSVKSGAFHGGLIGFLTVLSADLIVYGYTNMANLKAVFADVLAFTLICTIAGCVISWISPVIKKQLPLLL